MNLAIVLGYMFKDPTFKHTSNNSTMVTFTLKVPEVWFKDGQKNEKVEFVRCVVFDGDADKLQELMASKGRQVSVEGQINTYSYDKDGSKAYNTQINVTKFEVL